MYINNSLIFNFFLIYILLTAAYHFVDVTPVKYLIFTITLFAIVFLTIFVIKNVNYLQKNIFILFIFYILFIFIGQILNFGHSDLTFSIKYFGIFIFYLAGYIINYKEFNDLDFKKYSKKVVYLILLIPILVYLIDVFVLSKHDSSSIFLNRNNAVLFGIISSYIILLFFHSVRSYILFIIVNVIVYDTLGALIATIFTIFLIYIRSISFQKLLSFTFYLLIFTIAVVYAVNNIDLAIISRVKDAIKGFTVLFTYSSIKEMANISYGEMSSLSGTSDLSFLFRIKHWYNILTIDFNSDFMHILFGHGNDSTRHLTLAGLRAHNDYLRLLFEVGFLFWVTFIAFNLYIFRLIGINIYIIPFMIVVMYFLTENLIDNFLSMSLLYFILGLIAAKKTRKIL